MKTRWLLGFVSFAVAASCGGIIASPSDGGGGSDGSGSGSCSTDADCQAGFHCAYPVSGGCSAMKTCAPSQACKGAPYCACDDTLVFACADSPKPVRHAGFCPDASGPPPSCSGLACEVCDVSGFSPTPQARPIVGSNACTAAQITAFVAACVSPQATQATCTAWQQSDAGACPACMLTMATAASWGPLVCDSLSCSFDTGGCVDALFGEVFQEKTMGGPGSCGDWITDENGCISYACGACTNTTDFTTCSQSASANECKSYVDAASSSTMCNVLDASTSSTCFPQSDADYAAFINVFCGTGP